jgi:hypothetical protein
VAVVDCETLTLLAHRRVQRRTLQTVFGPIHIDRIGYGGRGRQSIHPLDADLQLPERCFSYELQRRLVQAALQGPFREATSRILDSTGLTIHNHSLEPLLVEAAADFDGFYRQRIADPSQPSASLLVVAVDCKGIPMVKPEPHRPPVRLVKEEKIKQKENGHGRRCIHQGALHADPSAGCRQHLPRSPQRRDPTIPFQA